jgi:hypothetical protein
VSPRGHALNSLLSTVFIGSPGKRRTRLKVYVTSLINVFVNMNATEFFLHDLRTNFSFVSIQTASRTFEWTEIIPKHFKPNNEGAASPMRTGAAQSSISFSFSNKCKNLCFSVSIDGYIRFLCHFHKFPSNATPLSGVLVE